jgi:hypothetical protein
MGFRKWLFKNGPGSPGHTARALVKLYENCVPKEVNEEEIPEVAIYSMIYLERHSWANKLNNTGSLLKNYNHLKLIEFTEYDMSLFVFVIECLETNQFRKGLTLGMDGVDEIIEVIREEVKRKRPDLIRINDSEYRTKAIIFADILLDTLETGKYIIPETLDAFFQCEDYPDGYLLRFYKDLTVQYAIIKISSGYIEFEKVSKWFTKEHRYSQKAIYKFYDSQITFKIKANTDTLFSYTCKFLSEDELLMRVENSATNEITERTFWRFTE